MEVDFNLLRKKLIKDYNAVIKKLNEAICTDVDMDRVIIPVNDMGTILDRLRTDIIMIGAVNDPAIKDCECVLDNSVEILEFLPNV